MDEENRTGKDNHPKAPLSVSEHTAPQQHVVIIQRVLIVSPV